MQSPSFKIVDWTDANGAPPPKPTIEEDLSDELPF
jgi:hypothetical protein